MSTTRYIVDNQSEQTINNEPILRPYKIFTALLTQSGTSSSVPLMNDPLTIGVTYEIEDNGGPGWDFTNVGAPDNEIGTKFIATGTTPISWTGARLISNEGAPTVIILENTIGETIWFTYEGVGVYGMNSNGLFTDKTFSIAGRPWDGLPVGASLGLVEIQYVNTSSIYITVSDTTFSSVDNLLLGTPIEIKVYGPY